MMRETPGSETVTLHVPFRVVKRGGRKEMRLPEGASLARRTDSTLVKAVARAFRWKRMLDTGEFGTIGELAEHEAIAPSYMTRVLRLTLLAPDIVEAILAGRQGPDLTLGRVAGAVFGGVGGAEVVCLRYLEIGGLRHPRSGLYLSEGLRAWLPLRGTALCICRRISVDRNSNQRRLFATVINRASASPGMEVEHEASVMSVPQPYRMSFSVGGLLINESVEVARLHVPGEAWDDTLDRALIGGMTSLPKAASRRRNLREIVNRLSSLQDEELLFLVERADRDEQAALLWVAACRAYRLVREFALEVVCERHLSQRLNLPLEAFHHFLDDKAEWDAGLAAIAPTTARKLRQILFRMMREAGLIDDDRQILTSSLSGSLCALLRRSAPADLAVFPGFALERN